MSKLKLYNAGNLFNEAEVKQRKWEGEQLRAKLPNVEVYNPIDAPVNDKSKNPTAEDIFALDTKQVRECAYMIADLTNNDVGTAMELGIALEINSIYNCLLKNKMFDALDVLLKEGYFPKISIIGVASDIRTPTAGNYEGVRVPYGLNQYVVGGILSGFGGRICNSFEEAMNHVENLESLAISKED